MRRHDNKFGPVEIGESFATAWSRLRTRWHHRPLTPDNLTATARQSATSIRLAEDCILLAHDCKIQSMADLGNLINSGAVK